MILKFMGKEYVTFPTTKIMILKCVQKDYENIPCFELVNYTLPITEIWQIKNNVLELQITSYPISKNWFQKSCFESAE